MTDDSEDGSFRIDREAQSFRLQGFKWRDFPAFLLAFILVICLLSGFNFLVFTGLGFFSKATDELILGLSIGYLVGVWIGGRRGSAGVPQQLPPLSDRVKQLALQPDSLIAAIKACREETGAGLKQAKTAVEAYIKQQKQTGQNR